MDLNNISVDLIKEKKEIELLKAAKDKMEELLTKLIKSKDDLVNSNLSGQTYEKCIEKNEYFVKNLTKRINEFSALISKLESSHVIYNNYIASMNKSTNGG